jgi:Uma2 family endonuclease
MSTAAVRRYTVEEYLALERDSETKHEFYDGEMFAMAGASEAHDLVAGNVFAELHAAVRSRDCRAHSSDMRVLCATGLYAYPDASVACGPRDIETVAGVETLKNPLLVVEVLSKSTEDYDRGRKFVHYRTIPSLKGYLLLAQNRPAAEHLAKQADGRWLISTAEGLESGIALPELGVTLRLADLYAKVVFPPHEDDLDDLPPSADADKHPRPPIR